MTITNPSVPELLPIGSRVKIGRGKHVWLILKYVYGDDGVLRYVTLQRETSADRVRTSISADKLDSLRVQIPATPDAA